MRDDAHGMVVECTNEGYEKAYLKLQLGYIGTRGAVLNNEFMRETTEMVCPSSVLGLLLSQGAEWKIQFEKQHKEWKNIQ